MNTLIVGDGTREHAIAWKRTQRHLVLRLFMELGNTDALVPGVTIPLVGSTLLT